MISKTAEPQKCIVEQVHILLTVSTEVYLPSWIKKLNLIVLLLNLFAFWYD